MRIGVISDTHGLLRPEALHALAGAQLIIHAGDVGAPEILTQLKGIAPVFAVRGNVDTQPWAQELPVTTVVETSGFHFYVLHNLRDLDLKPQAAGYDAVISGHTHQVQQRLDAGVLYLNPGSAGPRRFQLPVTLALLEVSRRPWKVEIIRLLEP
ncbi:MAG TPA: metallophosphoesterase family protein [Candidatus Limnocylindrales bacterium]|nr:metallophosphoesterase family protein [Candidatus Limnocylindrales bacterium]